MLDTAANKQLAQGEKVFQIFSANQVSGNRRRFSLKGCARLLAFAVLLTYGSMASAALIAYTDRVAWTAAAGTVDGGEDFSSFTTETSFDGTSLALADGISIGTYGADGRGI